jgi:hypothetical protein
MISEYKACVEHYNYIAQAGGGTTNVRFGDVDEIGPPPLRTGASSNR